ncbi:MAG: hypothetical protein R3F10_10845 [Lysobacteraceae bacterium]
MSFLAAQRAPAGCTGRSQARADELAAVNGFVGMMLTQAGLRTAADRRTYRCGRFWIKPSARSRISPPARTAGQVALLLGGAPASAWAKRQAQHLLELAQERLNQGFGADSFEHFDARYAVIEDLTRDAGARTRQCSWPMA